MSKQRTQRHLAAVLAADVVGYSKMMEADEEGTLHRLQSSIQEVVTPAIADHNGRLVKTTGDGLLVEFMSVVDAVRCAVVLQTLLGEREVALPADRRLQFRIGINLGDVMVEGADIFGDGVNIAARLEGLAEAGGILLSGTAYDQVKKQAGLDFTFLGEQRVKNIAESVRVYRVVLDPTSAGKIVARPHKLFVPALAVGLAALLVIGVIAAAFYIHLGPAKPARPSVAVMPFVNLGANPNEAYFADGITEDLITELAKLSKVDVIARNSVFKYRDQTVAPKEVGRDLGVRYVVEGSVRRNGDQIRISAQMIDVSSDSLLWADKYDRNIADVFAIQDDVVGAIMTALGIKPTVTETEVLARLPTNSLEAYDYFLRGEQAARDGSRPQLRRALEFYTKAEALDSTFADAFAADARTAVFVWRNVYDDVLPSPVAKKRAYEMAGKALEINPRASGPYATLAVLQAVDGQYDQALVSARRAVSLGPSGIDAQIALGFVLAASGKSAEATTVIATAQRLDPNLSVADSQVAGLVQLLNGNAADAIKTLEHARTDSPNVEDTHILLAAAYAEVDRMDEARKAVEQSLRIGITPSVEFFRMSFSFLRSEQDREALLGALIKAGMPMWPYGFQGDERTRLSGEDISRLVLGHTLRGKLYSGSPAIMQIGRDGKMVFRSTTLLVTGMAFVNHDKFCQQSEGLIALGRFDCGPVYRRAIAGNEPAFIYVNSTNVFYFSPID